MKCTLLIFIVTFVNICNCFSDIGKWDLPLSGDNCDFVIAKSLFKNSKLIALLHCNVKEPTNITVTFKWLPTVCSPDYFHYFEKNLVTCSSETLKSVYPMLNSTVQPLNIVITRPCHSTESIIFESDPASGNILSNEVKKAFGVTVSKVPPLIEVANEGIYLLKVNVQAPKKINATFHIEMVAPSGYLSAAIWPLLPFFGSMCAVYAVLCAGWLGVCAARWRDLLRIQYWIGAVALLGMLETATYYAIYSSINTTGSFNIEAYIFAEWLSVAKRALARMLVIIVSLGFGIVKPRLGAALQRVVGLGCAWGALASVEGWLRLHHAAGSSERRLLLSEAPLSLLDSAICWWVFVSLAHTMRTLQLRRNAIKLSLYRHFTNTLIFAVISSVIFMLYSIKSYRVLPCITEWKEVWMDEAYWHILFASVLTVIMILWRPTNNNQRYAFTPLLDNADDDDEEEDQFVNDAYGVKMRGTSLNSGDNDSREQNETSNTLDSDLRWVEENIPTSSLPLLDSDEEIINTKFEVSKMQ